MPFLCGWGMAPAEHKPKGGLKWQSLAGARQTSSALMEIFRSCFALVGDFFIFDRLPLAEVGQTGPFEG